MQEPVEADKDASPKTDEGELRKIADCVDIGEPILTHSVNTSEPIVPVETANDDDNAPVAQAGGSIVSSSIEPRPVVVPAQVRPSTRPQASDDHFLTLLAIGLVVALAALVIRKFYHSFSWISFK